MKYIRVSHLPYQTAKTAVPVYCGFVKMSLELKEKTMDYLIKNARFVENLKIMFKRGVFCNGKTYT